MSRDGKKAKCSFEKREELKRLNETIRNRDCLPTFKPYRIKGMGQGR